MRPTLPYLALVALASLAAAQERGGAADEPSLAIVGGRVFDGTGAAPIENGVVLVAGSRIRAVGKTGEVDLPEGIERIDASGAFVMPGVIDNHVHVTTPLTEGDDVLSPWLAAGVTTLVDTGTVRQGVRQLRRMVKDVCARPPRLYVAGPILTAPGGYPATRPEPGVELIARGVIGEVAARKAVADILDVQQADLIKVAIEAGFDKDYGDEGWPVPNASDLRAIVSATHERGRLARVHTTQPGELRVALRAGFDVAAHTPITHLPLELLEQAAEREMIFVSTVNIWGERSEKRVRSNLRRYHGLGGPIALGTDYPYQAGSTMPVAEMRELVAAGLEPVDVLVASTLNGARALGLDAVLGTLEPGKLADILVVAGDPLEDVAAMANVRVVVLAGQIVRR